MNLLIRGCNTCVHFYLERNRLCCITGANPGTVVAGGNPRAVKAGKKGYIFSTLQALTLHIPGPFVQAFFNRRILNFEGQTGIHITDLATFKIAFL